MISIISAVDKNFLMGDGERNKLPWYLPADFVYFKKITLGKTVIMGSKTYFSLPEKSRPLPGRKNIVLSRNKNLKIEGVEVLNNVEDLSIMRGSTLHGEIFVIGGAEIYKLFFEKDLVDKVYLTEINGEFEGNIFFPNFFLNSFQEIYRKHRKKDKQNHYDIDFIVYKKK